MERTPKPRAVRKITLPRNNHENPENNADTEVKTGLHQGEIIDDEPDNYAGVEPDDYAGVEPDKNKPTRERRTGEQSGDKTIKRNTPPRRDLVTFTDEENQKPFSNRRKRTRLNKGGMFFNERDREIVLLVAAHGWLDMVQLAELTKTTRPQTLRRPLKRLVDHGLLDDKYTGLENQNLYTVTTFGLRKTGAEGFQTGVTPRLQTVEHTDAITAVSIQFTKKGRQGVIFMTERELYAAAASGKLSPRILKKAPWAAGYSDFDKWVPSTISDKGAVITKRPDGYLLENVNGKPLPPTPVEIERTMKDRSDYYQQALLILANTAREGHIKPAVLYFAPAETKVLENLKKALEKVYEKTPNFTWPAMMPKIHFEVHDLGSFYTPISAKKNWIAAGKHGV
jgi:hypothetical protein